MVAAVVGLALELVAIVFVAWKVKRVGRIRTGERQPVLVDTLEAALRPELGRFGAVLATELAVLYYAFAGWFRPTPTAGFSTYRERSYFVVIAVLCFLVLVETAGAHVLVMRLSNVAAWILTALSLYAVLWFVGDAQAVRLHSIVVSPEGIAITQGVRWRTFVPLASVESATAIDSAPKDVLRMGNLGANVLLTLREPVLVRGPFGLKRSAARMTLTVDGREDFLRALRELRAAL